MKASSFERHRAILRIALPAIITNITTPILGLVDTAMAGRLGSPSYIGAIAIGAALFNMIYWLMNFLRAGTSGQTAQAIGADDKSAADDILFRGIFIGFLAGIFIIILSPLIAYIFIPFMEADAPTSALAEDYFRTVIWGAPAYLSSYAVSGWLLGNQNSLSTLRIAVVTNVLNIAISLSLVLGFGMKLKGIALGTAISQWVAFFYGLFIVYRRYNPRLKGFQKVFEGRELKYFFKLNFDIFLRTLCLVGVTMWFTRAGASMGSGILAANSILMQLFLLFSFFMDGFAYAGEAIAGKELGAGRLHAIKSLEKDLLCWGLVLSLFGVTVYFFAGDLIFALLTDSSEVINIAADYKIWAVTIPLFGFMAFIYDGIYIGMTLTRLMLATMLAAIGVFFLVYFSLCSLWGNHALWLAFSLYLLTRGIGQWLIFRKK